MNKLRINLLIIPVGLTLLASNSQAQVYWDFVDDADGLGVTATVSGSFVSDLDNQLGFEEASYGAVSSHSIGVGSAVNVASIEVPTIVTNYSEPLRTGYIAADSYNGVFYVDGHDFYWDLSLGPGGNVAAGTDFGSGSEGIPLLRWENETASTILTANSLPTVLWQGPSGLAGDQVRLRVTPVPEPASTALLGIGGLALLLRRKK